MSKVERSIAEEFTYPRCLLTAVSLLSALGVVWRGATMLGPSDLLLVVLAILAMDAILFVVRGRRRRGGG
jgi:hypothetical protein